MERAVRELEKRLIEVTDAGDRLTTLVELAHRHADGQRNREGLRAAREALQIARANEDTEGAARALRAASRCERQRGELAAAVSSGLEALELAREGDGRAEALQVLARALLDARSLDPAHDFAECAVAEAAAAAEPLCEARARILLAQVLQQRERFVAARRELRIATHHYRDLRDAAGLRLAIVALADNYRREGVAHLCLARLARAQRCWNQALKVFHLALDMPGRFAEEPAVRAGIAECLCRLGRTSQAYAELARALEGALHGGTPRVTATCYLWESHALKSMGDMAGAVRACHYARIAAEQMDHDELLVQSLEALVVLHEAHGRFGSAVDAARRARLIEREREAALAFVRDDIAALLFRSGHTRVPRLRSAA